MKFCYWWLGFSSIAKVDKNLRMGETCLYSWCCVFSFSRL